MDVTVEVVFKLGSASVRVLWFHDGDGIYRIRFSPGQLGRLGRFIVSEHRTAPVLRCKPFAGVGQE